MTEQQMPEAIRAIQARGSVVWAEGGPPAALAARFTRTPIPVAGIRHVRVWGLQVDDERALPGRERTSIPDEDLWQVELVADDGSRYEVSAAAVRPAP